MKAQIEKWIKERKVTLRQELKKSKYTTPLSDKIEKDIVAALKSNFDDLECDFILETLTHLGASPCVIYDDNGMWAIIAEGTQPVVSGKDRLEGHIGFTFFVEKKDWFSTIRKALKRYVKQRWE